MTETNIREEYTRALRMGQKECKELAAAGKDPYPAVLDDLLANLSGCNVQELPVQEISIDRMVGTKSAGRVSTFSAGFYPLLEADSEFAAKWMALCKVHLSDTGIRDAIECYEYLGDFYVQEGNKRLSVLKYFGASQIPCRIKRILPAESDDPRIKAYYEFLGFYKSAGIYDVQLKKPGEYAKLLSLLGKQPGELWTEAERRQFSSRYHYFKVAFSAVGGQKKDVQPEEALLLWLQVHSYDELSSLSAAELKRSLSSLWGDVKAASEEKLFLKTQPDPEKTSLLEKVIGSAPRHLNIAVIYQQDPDASTWTQGHQKGADHLAAALSDRVAVRHYYHADTPEQAEALLEKAVSDGAELVFTTAPLLLLPTLKSAVKYPRIKFLNCSTGTQLSSVRSYYCRTYEGKFITGVIAGALANNDMVGYVGSYPILGVPASINAFALGVRMTNPRAKILLEWSCLEGDPVQKLREKGVRVISNRDIPVSGQRYMDQGRYGTFLTDQAGRLVPLASPCWMWGELYETVARSILSGSWKEKKDESVNYWWGMDSGTIDVELTEQVPAGVRSLAEILMRDLREGRLDPFRQRIVTREGTMINDGSRTLDSVELLKMDWLCDTVEGHIPEYEEVLPMSRALVRELGVHRERIPPEIGGIQ